ncbi:g11294 [Coccomyxa elongata]
MVALGGSITCGSITHNVPSYIEQVFQWINATFPHADNTFINSCKGGAGSTEAGLCFDAKVPRNADLITMEFTLNDAYHHEADMSAFLQYYRIPELSMRRALYRDTMEGTVGFRPEETVCDMMHPNDLGHRYYADVMVAFLEDHAWAAATGSPDGLLTGPRSPLPAPLIPNNYEHGQQCAIDEALVTLVQPSQGWEWVDEGKLGHHKRGWRSVTPGSKLITKPMDTTSKVEPSNEPVLLILGVLKSYEHMGQAVLACPFLRS